jgi:hypothetical protein
VNNAAVELLVGTIIEEVAAVGVATPDRVPPVTEIAVVVAIFV